MAPRDGAAASRLAQQANEEQAIHDDDTPGAGGGLRALLKQAAATRKSTLEYFRANPTECIPKARRESRQLADSGDSDRGNQRPASVSPHTALQRSLPENALSVEPGVVPAPEAEGLRLDSGGGTDVKRGDDTGLQEQLQKSQAMVRQLQDALCAEQDASRKLDAQLRGAQDASDSLHNKISELEARLDKQTKLAREAQNEQHSAITEEQLQEFADEVEEIQEKLVASELANTKLQTEWETLQQVTQDDTDELKRKLVVAECAKTKAETDRDAQLRDMRDELEEIQTKLASSQSATHQAGSAKDAMQHDLTSKIAALEKVNKRLEAAAAEAAAAKAAADRDSERDDDTSDTDAKESAPLSLKAMVTANSIIVDLDQLTLLCARASSRETPGVFRKALRQWSLHVSRRVREGRQAAVPVPFSRPSMHRSIQSDPTGMSGLGMNEEGVQNGGGQCISEGVQTVSMVREAKAAQTAPAAGAGIHTQTARVEGVPAAAQTVAPAPGIVANTQTTTATTATHNTQTTTATTTTTATGTGDEQGAAGGMDMVEVAPGPAPVPRELAQMERYALHQRV